MYWGFLIAVFVISVAVGAGSAAARRRRATDARRVMPPRGED